MTIRAGRLTVNPNGFVRAAGTTSLSGGLINIEAGSVAISGSIDANGTPGGTINLTSTGDVSIGGASGLTARALSRAEVGGTVTVVAATVTLTGTLNVLGGFDALGGDALITSTGSVVITGTINATGGDGGSIDIEAGAMPGAGDIAISDSAALRADATLGGGFGGTIDLFARGDGVERGFVAIDGLLSAIGLTGGEDLGGGAGGCITVTAAGDIVNTRTASSITAEGGGPDGDGGEVELSTTVGAIEINGTVEAGSAGPESSGGSITIDAAGTALINGALRAHGGDGGGGEVAASSSTANVEVARTATISVDATAGGSGGAICIESGVGASEDPRAIVIEGNLSAVGGANAGGGGSIELDGSEAVRVAPTGALRAGGALGGGRGGTVLVDVTDGPALIDGTMIASGGSPTGVGGLITVDASQRVSITAVADARGFGDGGEIGLASTGAVDVRANLLVGSTTGIGGTIEIRSEGEAMIAASLIADGLALPGGRIDAEACVVTLCGLDSPACPSGGTGIMSALGPEGRNRTVGRDATVILGTMRASGNDGGRNQLLYNGDEESEPFILGTVTPNPEIIVSNQVLPCPACGNDNIEPPETCDDGNELDGDGCSANCQAEAPIPGDANGDFTLAENDRGFAVSEIFDGDGDSVGTVSGGSFPGGPGADANDDTLVTGADLVAITRLLAP
jgi:cysteine-rich repeat protein